MKSVTLDTNSVDERELVDVGRRIGCEFAFISVTERELEQSDINPVSAYNSKILETLVLGESELGQSLLGSSETKKIMEFLLQIISNGSFPAAGKRSNITSSQRRQIRDAIIISAHIRKGRDIFVTNDAKGFINDDRRDKIEKEFYTKIMTSDGFFEYCQSNL